MRGLVKKVEGSFVRHDEIRLSQPSQQSTCTQSDTISKD
jgi:hypothetical protein